MMTNKPKGIPFYILTSLYAFVVAITAMGLVAPWVDVHLLSPIQLIPSFVVFTIPLHLLAAVFYARKSLKWCLVSLLSIAGCIWIGNKDIKQKNQENLSETDALKVVSFNVSTFDYKPEKIDSVANLLNSLSSDVIALQEFREHKLPGGKESVRYLKGLLQMPHARFVHLPAHKHGSIIFSRYPIVKVDTLFLPQKEINTGVLVTIESPMGKIGIGNIHLSSFQFAQTLDKYDNWKEKLSAVYQRTRVVLPLQQQKVNQILLKTKDYPYPMVISGDFNTSPHTRIASQFRERFQDSFLKAGTGIGWTYPILGPAGLRIDYQYASSELTILDHQVIKSEVSDHYPILATYRLEP
jgi:vancomycin resistance protein VanJ